MGVGKMTDKAIEAADKAFWEERIEKIIAAIMHDYGLDVYADAITQDALFGNDLGMDSGDVHAVIIQCEEAFKISIPDDAITEQSRVGEITKLVANLLIEKEARETYKKAIRNRNAWLYFPET